MSFGENLKKARKDAEMTQSELAQRVGITERSVYNYEKNSRAPKVDIVEKFAQALGVPVLTEQEFLAMLQDAPAEQETT